MSTRIHSLPTERRRAQDWSRWQAELPVPAALARRTLGTIVTDHRTSWVRQLATPSGSVFVKVYQYDSWARTLLTLGRRTAPWQTSRAVREFDALAWLQDHGLPAAEPLAVYEWRQFGFLRTALLVTRAFPAPPSDRLLEALAGEERRAVAAAIGRFVARLHWLGFRDGNLDLRNLLVQRDGAGWTVTKVDSPRHRLVQPGRPTDRAARADWARLLPQLEALQVAEAALEAAGQRLTSEQAKRDPRA